MPAVSKKQFNMINAIRSKFKTPSDTPEGQAWVWDNDWLDVDYDKLPEDEIKQESYKRYERLFKEQDNDYEIDEKVKEILTLLRDNSYGNEESRKELLSLLTQLHRSKDRTARLAFKKIGNLFTEIGNELLGEVGNKEEE